MKDNLTKAKYSIYAYVAYSLFLSISSTVTLFFMGYLSSYWEAVSVWFFFYTYVFPYLLIALIIYFCFEIFKKGREKFKWGLFTIALYYVLVRVVSILYILVQVRSGVDNEYLLLQFQEPFYYISLLFLIAFIYGVYLLIFTKISENVTAPKGTIKQEPSTSETDVAEELEKFFALKDKGIISEEEFNKKKKELLK